MKNIGITLLVLGVGLGLAYNGFAKQSQPLGTTAPPSSASTPSSNVSTSLPTVSCVDPKNDSYTKPKKSTGSSCKKSKSPITNSLLTTTR